MVKATCLPAFRIDGESKVLKMSLHVEHVGCEIYTVNVIRGSVKDLLFSTYFLRG